MLPLIREGKDSVILVAPDNLKKHDIVLYRRKNGAYVLHRIIKIRDDEFIMCGDNQGQPERGIYRENIIAKVSSVISDSGADLIASPGYERYLSSLKYRRVKRRATAVAKKILNK